MKCWICGDLYYGQTECEPAEPCMCGVGIPIRWPHNWRQRVLRIVWGVLRLLWGAEAWLYRVARNATERWERYL
jgi:hypothetical protein